MMASQQQFDEDRHVGQMTVWCHGLYLLMILVVPSARMMPRMFIVVVRGDSNLPGRFFGGANCSDDGKGVPSGIMVESMGINGIIGGAKCSDGTKGFLVVPGVIILLPAVFYIFPRVVF